jgi:restriction system protein
VGLTFFWVFQRLEVVGEWRWDPEVPATRSAIPTASPAPILPDSSTSATTLPPPPPPPRDLTDQFRNLDWFQFEKIVALICRKIGYEVERRGGAHADGGIDLLLRQDDKTQGVQCKHWKAWQVGVKSVREFLGALTAAGLQEGVFVSLGKFTPDAAALASRHNIQLVDAAGLADLVEQAGVRCDPEFVAALHEPRKYCPKCERELVLRTAAKGQNLGGQFWGCSAYPRCSYILRT